MNNAAKLKSTGFLSLRLPVVLLAAGILVCIAASAGVLRADDEDKLPEPTNKTLTTSDGAVLVCRWYPSPKSEENGKTVVPVIILPGWGGQRSQYDGLASSLQRMGHAVIVPDLRGHGDSTTLRRPNQGADMVMGVTPEGDFRLDNRPVSVSAVMTAMVEQDVETVKSFLMDLNNQGQLNIELLCVVAVEESCIVALNWAYKDWTWKQYPNYKEGLDVKALVLISPVLNFEGATVPKALSLPVIEQKLSIMIVAGTQDSRSFSKIKSLHNRFERARPPLPKGDTPEIKKARLAVQDLFLIELTTTLQGLKLFSRRDFDLIRKIAAFIQLRLVKQADHPGLAWRDRTR